VRMATLEADKRQRRESRGSEQSSDSATPPGQPLASVPPVAPGAVPHWGVSYPYQFPVHPTHMGPWSQPSPGGQGSFLPAL